MFDGDTCLISQSGNNIKLYAVIRCKLSRYFKNKEGFVPGWTRKLIFLAIRKYWSLQNLFTASPKKKYKGHLIIGRLWVWIPMIPQPSVATSQESKNNIILLWLTVKAVTKYLSITVTLTDCGHLWSHVCRRGQIEISSKCVILSCDVEWLASCVWAEVCSCGTVGCWLVCGHWLVMKQERKQGENNNKGLFIYYLPYILKELKPERMGNHENISDFEKGQIVMARRLGQNISITPDLVRCCHHAVFSSHQKWNNNW